MRALLLALLLTGCAANRRAGDLTVELEPPPGLTVGHRVSVPIRLGNQGEAPLVVRDLDLKKPGLLTADGERRLAADLDPSAPAKELHDYRSYRLDLTLEPGQSQELRLDLWVHDDWRPPAAVALTGEIDVCLGNFHNFTVALPVTVSPARAARSRP